MSDTPAQIINEAVETASVDELRLHPANPREGDVSAIADSIRENGFYGTCVVQESTGHVLAGNHRLQAARQVGLPTVPVVYVDVGDERAMRILLADNRTADIAGHDEDALADLLEHLDTTEDGLSGTGYDGDALDDLLYDLGRDAPGFEPASEDEQGQLDETDSESHTCPECGHEFTS